MLSKKIQEDYVKAMKERDALRASTLSFLRADFNNYAIEKRKKELDDNDALAVIKKQAKQRQDSIEQFEKGGRQDLADKEKKELEILRSYLPAQISDEELKTMIQEAIAATGAASAKDTGRVMKEVMAKAAGRADGKVVCQILREILK